MLRRNPGEIDLSRAIAVIAGDRIIQRQILNLLQYCMLRIAVLWIFACSNLFVNYPLIKHKGTVVNHVLWLTPAIAMFSDDMMRNREQRRPGEHRREPRNRLLKRNFKSTIIRRFDTQRCNICFTRNNSCGIVNVRLCQIASKRACRFRVNRALPAEDKILCRQRLTVGPLQTATQMENIALAAVQYLPAFSLSGLHLAFTVHPYQTFKQIQHNLRGSILLHLLRVERTWVAMIVVTKDLLRGERCVGGNVSSVERSRTYQADQP